MLASLSPEEAMRELNTSGLQPLDPAQVIAYLRQEAELPREYAQALELPEAEYREWLAAKKANLSTEGLVATLDHAAVRTQAMIVKGAMAAAGLAVMQEGPGALQSHPDPSTGQPFAYTQTADGFELQSSFQVRDKPVKLSFK